LSNFNQATDKEIAMTTNPNVQSHSTAWVTFTYLSFSISVLMVFFGIYFLPLDMWVKGYLLMGAAMLVQSSIIVTKTLRDVHEGGRLVNRMEDARAERLLMEASRAN
jgi:hypothetical protein